MINVIIVLNNYIFIHRKGFHNGEVYCIDALIIGSDKNTVLHTKKDDRTQAVLIEIIEKQGKLNEEDEILHHLINCLKENNDKLDKIRAKAQEEAIECYKAFIE